MGGGKETGKGERSTLGRGLGHCCRPTPVCWGLHVVPLQLRATPGWGHYIPAAGLSGSKELEVWGSKLLLWLGGHWGASRSIIPPVLHILLCKTEPSSSVSHGVAKRVAGTCRCKDRECFGGGPLSS